MDQCKQADEANFWLGAPPPGVARKAPASLVEFFMAGHPQNGAPISPNPKDAIGRAKTPLNLLPAPALVEIAKAMRLGADKYGAYNWRESKVARTVYTTAAMRHILADQDGETFDPDVPAGQHIRHLALACASLMIAMDAEANGMMLDDRGPKGVAGALMRGTPTAPGRPPAFRETMDKLRALALPGGIVMQAPPPTPATPRPFLWYLATPYSACPLGLSVGHTRAVDALRELQRRKVAVFCPIAHSHQSGKGLPRDHDFWMDVDRPFMDRCDGLLVLQQPGWRESRGIKYEIERFHRAGKPQVCIADPHMEVEVPLNAGLVWDNIAGELARVAGGQG